MESHNKTTLFGGRHFGRVHLSRSPQQKGQALLGHLGYVCPFWVFGARTCSAFLLRSCTAVSDIIEVLLLWRSRSLRIFEVTALDHVCMDVAQRLQKPLFAFLLLPASFGGALVPTE